VTQILHVLLTSLVIANQVSSSDDTLDIGSSPSPFHSMPKTGSLSTQSLKAGMIRQAKEE